MSESAQRQARLWTDGASEWAEMAERVEPVFWDQVLEIAGVGAGTKLLDAGCGSGGAMTRAALRRSSVTGIDATPALLNEARKRLPNADLRVADMEALPFGDHEFDVAIAINSLQFTGNPARAASEMTRVAKSACAVVWAWDGCDQRLIFEAIVDLFPKKPSGRGPFALSLPGELETAFEDTPHTVQDLPIEFVSDSLDLALRGQMAAGPTRRSVEILGREPVENAVRKTLERFRLSDGRVRLQQRFHCLVATSR
jgi:SAM-dependent methyltransferase